MNKYIIIAEAEANVVESRVTAMLEQGWRLAGGISMVYKHEHNEHGHLPGHIVYAQAMVKENG